MGGVLIRLCELSKFEYTRNQSYFVTKKDSNDLLQINVCDEAQGCRHACSACLCTVLQYIHRLNWASLFHHCMPTGCVRNPKELQLGGTSVEEKEKNELYDQKSCEEAVFLTTAGGKVSTDSQNHKEDMISS